MQAELLRNPPYKHFQVELSKRYEPIDMYVVGSLSASLEANQRALGLFTAQQFKYTIDEASRKGKYVLCDMPTGSTPKPTWEALREMIDKNEIDLERVIWVGHEAELPPQEHPPLGYETQRIEILQKLGINIQRIINEHAAKLETIEGNYLAMHSFKPGDEINIDEANRCAAEYDRLLATLLNRRDIVSFGMYGVGGDGHGFGEFQRKHMWPEEWEKTQDTFLTPLSDYSYRHGFWPIFDEHNIPMADNALGEDENRKKFPDVQLLMGMGRNTLARLDNSIHVFNSSSKAQAFEQTLKALGGQIRSETGITFPNPTGPACGETMLTDFKTLAEKWQQEEKIRSDCGFAEKETRFTVVQEILKSLNQSLSKEEYFELWHLFSQYFGDQTPVSMMLMERAQRGKKNVIVVTADVAKNTGLVERYGLDPKRPYSTISL